MVHVVRFDPVCMLCQEEVEPYRSEMNYRKTPTEMPWIESFIACEYQALHCYRPVFVEAQD
jgi:hypothetical protein